ncbi:hypothetical protein [Hirschia litorea]|uniref:Uncharacterized protein n=1 Tax=Hirschia litorea TaxID=1199156 RepID=A0ABW2IL63_9PROT
MNGLSKRQANETETHALARRLVERSGLNENQADQAVDDYLHAEGGSIGAVESPSPKGKVDMSRASIRA